jgi:3',5'-cyclic-AMP phosphodiesterase
MNTWQVQSEDAIDRRAFLKGTAGVFAGLAIAGGQRQAVAAVPPKRVLRVAHLTDVHVYPDRKAPEGMAACLRHVQAQADKPELILFGGDCIMDAFAQTRLRSQIQWAIWKSVLKAENALPYKFCIGNHDIWGWDKAKSQATGNEADFGKKWAVDVLGMPRRYYSFRQAGWHFIALDSVQPGVGNGSYSAYLDEEQLDWLTKELAGVPATTPILIWSHVPIVSAMPLVKDRKKPTDDLSVGAGLVHTDSRALVDLFAKHPNVKVCLSGHLHLVEHVQIKGVNFHCNGAVCGLWWKGKNSGIPEGYAILDLFDDGSYTCQYHAYGWTPAPALLNLE